VHEEAKINENLSEIKKSGTNRILIGIVIFLGVVILLCFLIFSPQLFTKIHKYKFSFTHNGKPLEIGPTGVYNDFVYSIDFYTNNSTCFNDYLEFTSTNSSSIYLLDSNSNNYGKNLSYYESQNYAFDFFGIQKSFNPNLLINWFVVIISKNPFDANLNYNQLPKLTKDFSISFEIPIFNISSYQKFINGKNATFHAEFADKWIENNDFYCRFSRIYDNSTDVSLPNCTFPLFYAEETPGQCAHRYEMGCGIPRASYTVRAIRSDKGIDCSIQLSELTSGKKYSVYISTNLISNNFYQSYSTKIEEVSV